MSYVGKENYAIRTHPANVKNHGSNKVVKIQKQNIEKDQGLHQEAQKVADRHLVGQKREI